MPPDSRRGRPQAASRTNDTADPTAGFNDALRVARGADTGRRIGCPCGCISRRGVVDDDCILNRPMTLTLDQCGVREFITDETGSRLTCSRRCSGVCERQAVMA